jgi:hypothetical protein
MRAALARPGDAGRELARMLATLAWVVAGSVLVLGVLGTVPALLGGEPRGVRTIASVAEAERILRSRIAEPAYFPQRLGWPPKRIRISGLRGGSVALFLAARDGGPGVELLQSAPGGTIAPELLGDPSELRSRRTTVAGRPARIADVVVGGETWTSLAWELGDRAVVLRSRGEVEELYRMARSLRVEGGR